MKSGSYKWEPSTEAEVAYYDKLFKVIDRKKAGAVSGPEVVKLLSLSGLPKAQLQEVWTTAKTSSGQLLQRHEFYAAMRVVSLAQSGETTLTRKRLRETATNEIPMAQLKSAPKPFIENSKGKKPPPQPPSKPATAVKDLGDNKVNAKDAEKKGVSIVMKKAKRGTNGGSKTGNSSNCGSLSQDKKETQEFRKVEKHEFNTKTGNAKVLTTTKKGKMSRSKQRARSDNDQSMTTSSDDTKNVDGSDSGSEGYNESGANIRGRTRGDESDGNASSNGHRSRRNINGSEKPASDKNGNASDGGCESNYSNNSTSSTSSSTKGENGGKHNDEKRSRADSNAGSSSGSDFASDEDSRSSKNCGGEPPKACSFEKSLMSSESSSNSDSHSDSHSNDCGSERTSSCDGNEGGDPFGMTEKARLRYQGIFAKEVDDGTGFMSGKQAVGILSKSGLDKDALVCIWRMSDLNEDGQLSTEEFAIAFHLVTCIIQKKLDLPNELPKSFWPDGYVPPAVRERQEEEARLKRRQEKLKVNKNREKEEGSVRESTDKGTLEVTISEHVSAAQRKQNKGGRKKTQQGIKDATKTEKQLEEQRRNEEKMREVAALQKKEELARKRAARTTAAGKNIGRKKRATPAAVDSSPKDDENKELARPLSVKTREGTNGGDEKTVRDSRKVAENDYSNEEDNRSEANDGETPKKAKRKKKRAPSSAGQCELGRSLGDKIGEVGGDASPVGPLTPAQRRAMKTRARARRLDQAARKKEEACRDARLAELDKTDGATTFSLKAMEPMKLSADNGNLNLLAQGGGGSDPTLARLSAPLPHLTRHPGRPPSLEAHQASIAFPSGKRRASILTSSLELRLGPKLPKEKVPQVVVEDSADGCGDRISASDASESLGLVRCRVCAAVMPSGHLQRHILSTCRLLPCPLCLRLLLPANEESHIEKSCPNRKTICARCGEAVVLSDFASHEREGNPSGCRRKVVSCSACGEFCLANELEQHEVSECPEREIKCSSCGDALPARNLFYHVSWGCRQKTWTCGCGNIGPIPLTERPGHLKNCDAFLDAWEASIEKVMAQMPNIEVFRRIGKVMILSRVEDPELALIALSECKGNASLAARRISDDREYLDELSLAAGIVNVKVFLNALKKPGKRRNGALWQETT